MLYLVREYKYKGNAEDLVYLKSYVLKEPKYQKLLERLSDKQVIYDHTDPDGTVFCKGERVIIVREQERPYKARCYKIVKIKEEV